MKRRLNDGNWHVLGPRQPRIAIESADKWVRSGPIPTRGDLSLQIRGSYDSIVRFPDGTRAVCDFKTSPIKPEHLTKYGRQLHAYAYALENPALGEAQMIDRLGLAVFEPDSFEESSADRASLAGRFQWVEIPRDNANFHDFLIRVAELLNLESAPDPGDNCQFCEYRDTTRNAA